jgi:ubiquinone/menaquinone biosynthesis C-methylase UbiE
MLNIDLFNHAAIHILRLCGSDENVNVADIKEIEKKFDIQYIAPLDMKQTSFSDNVFDACITTNTLEHIPKQDIINIMNELKRVVRNKGIISFVIDYSDHYAHTDRNIGRLNFLRYSSQQFQRWNHRVHYQNRLRHYDYAGIFRNAGLQVLKEDALQFAEPPADISNEFRLDDPTLSATKGVFVLSVDK